MDLYAWEAGLKDLEETLGTASHPTYSDGERKHLRRHIYEREDMTPEEWQGVVDNLQKNLRFLPKIRDFREALQYVRASRPKSYKMVSVPCNRCNPHNITGQGGFLYVRSDRWSFNKDLPKTDPLYGKVDKTGQIPLGRQVVPCGCGNTPQSMSDIPTLDELVRDGRAKLEDFVRHDGTGLLESEEEARDRNWMKLEALYAAGKWVPKWIARRIEGEDVPIPGAQTREARDEISAAEKEALPF